MSHKYKEYKELLEKQKAELRRIQNQRFQAEVERHQQARKAEEADRFVNTTRELVNSICRGAINLGQIQADYSIRSIREILNNDQLGNLEKQQKINALANAKLARFTKEADTYPSDFEKSDVVRWHKALASSQSTDLQTWGLRTGHWYDADRDARIERVGNLSSPRRR